MENGGKCIRSELKYAEADREQDRSLNVFNSLSLSLSISLSTNYKLTMYQWPRPSPRPRAIELRRGRQEKSLISKALEAAKERLRRAARSRKATRVRLIGDGVQPQTQYQVPLAVQTWTTPRTQTETQNLVVSSPSSASN